MEVTGDCTHTAPGSCSLCVCSLLLGRGCHTPVRGRGCWPRWGPRPRPLHVREYGRGQGSCSRSWGCGYLLGRGRRRGVGGVKHMHPSPDLPSPHHRVEGSESRTWVSVLLRASESCCRRTEWCCPPLVSGSQTQLGSYPIVRGFPQSSAAH